MRKWEARFEGERLVFCPVDCTDGTEVFTIPATAGTFDAGPALWRARVWAALYEGGQIDWDTLSMGAGEASQVAMELLEEAMVLTRWLTPTCSPAPETLRTGVFTPDPGFAKKVRRQIEDRLRKDFSALLRAVKVV